jgi:hypothetical protein
VVVGSVVRQRWALGGFLVFRAAKLAQMLDLREGMVDERDPTESESASRPPNRFWCLNDKTIKELMTFAMCEIRKMSYKLH